MSAERGYTEPKMPKIHNPCQGKIDRQGHKCGQESCRIFEGDRFCEFHFNTLKALQAEKEKKHV